MRIKKDDNNDRFLKQVPMKYILIGIDTCWFLKSDTYFSSRKYLVNRKRVTTIETEHSIGYE